MPLAGSASAIVGNMVKGHHVLHIEGYSRTKEDLATGKSIRSRRFTAGGYPWRIEYWPNGKTASHAEFISIFLILDDTSFLRFQARARFSLLDQAGTPVASHTRTTDLCLFSDVSCYSHASRCGFDAFIKREVLEKSEHLEDDCFKIRCDVFIPKEVRTEDRAVAPAIVPVPVPPSDLGRHLGNLLQAKDGADVTFQVAGETFAAHKCVLAARSPVFRAQLFGAMKESTTHGTAEEVVIRVDDMEPEAFGALLAFLYTDALPADIPAFPGKRQSAMNQHLLVAADKYNLERLKLICEDHLHKHIETGTAATILALAEQHNCQMLKMACIQFLSSPSVLKKTMKTDDGFEHLARSCPSVLKDLMSNVSTRAPTDLVEPSMGWLPMSWYAVLAVVTLCVVLLSFYAY